MTFTSVKTNQSTLSHCNYIIQLKIKAWGYKLPQINWKLPKQYYKFKLLKLKPNEQTFEWIEVNSVQSTELSPNK